MATIGFLTFVMLLNIVYVIAEKNYTFYKTNRFWLILGFAIALMYLFTASNFF